LQVSTFWLLY